MPDATTSPTTDNTARRRTLALVFAPAAGGRMRAVVYADALDRLLALTAARGDHVSALVATVCREALDAADDEIERQFTDLVKRAAGGEP